MNESGPRPLDQRSTDILERSLLGSLLLVGVEALPKVTRMLAPDGFARAEHRAVYEAILAVARDGADPDLTLVIAELDSAGELDRVGGAAFVSGLLDEVPCADNVLHYARHVRERAVLRRLARKVPR